MNQPNFLGIGALKSATTWTAETLAAHPQIFLAHGKELDYFTTNFDRGEYWYLQQFATAKQDMVGEFSVSYLSRSELAAPRIATFNPQVKLIAVLRDPVERAYSEYRWKKQRGETNLPFREAWQQFPGLLGNGLYYRKLLPFLERFPREQILLIRQDDVRAQSARTAQKLYRFLGVAEDFTPPQLHRVVGKTIETRNKRLEQSRIAVHGWLKEKGAARLISLYKAMGLSSLYRKLNARRSGSSLLTAEDRQLLIEHFRDDLLALEQATGLRVEPWLKRNGK